MGPVEKRLHPRRELATKVIFEDELGEGLFYVDSVNISMGGLFLASDVPLRIGTMLFLSFALPPYKRPLRVTGEVVRIAKLGGEGDGIGIRFVGLPENMIGMLKKYLGND